MSGSLNLDFSVVRRLRKQAGMTLGDVAERSGLSIASLSKLERNQNLIELETLYRIARVFDLSASDLLALSESRTSHVSSIQRYESGPFRFEKLSWQEIDIFHATAKAGESHQQPEAHGDEYEICWVRKGLIEIVFDYERHTLKAGQAIQFDAALKHTYRILEDATLIIAHLQKRHRF